MVSPTQNGDREGGRYGVIYGGGGKVMFLYGKNPVSETADRPRK